MGDWFGSGSRGVTPAAAAAPAPAAVATATPSVVPTATPDLSTVLGSAYGLSKEFAADNPVRMPTPTDSSLLVAARLKRMAQASSGRDSTRLVGTQVYGNSFLGSVG